MPPKASSTSTSLTDREMEQLRNYHCCMTTKPEIDIEKFAAMSGFGSVASARASVHRLLQKITNASSSSAKDVEGNDSVPATPVSKKAGGRKREADDATLNADVNESPSKKKKSPVKRKAKASSEAASQEEEPLIKGEGGENGI